MSDGAPPTLPTIEQLLERIGKLEAEYGLLRTQHDETQAMVIHQAEKIDKIKRVFSRFSGIIETLKEDVVK